MKTWSGSRASHGKQNRTGTRARHLSDYVQVEDLKNKNHVRSASMSAGKSDTHMFPKIHYILNPRYIKVIFFSKLMTRINLIVKHIYRTKATKLYTHLMTDLGHVCKLLLLLL